MKKLPILLLGLLSITSYAQESTLDTISVPKLQNKKSLKIFDYDYFNHGKVWIKDGSCENIANKHKILDGDQPVTTATHSEEACLSLNATEEVSQSDLVDEYGYRQASCRTGADEVLASYEIAAEWSEEKKAQLIESLTRKSERKYRRCSRLIRKQHKEKELKNQRSVIFNQQLNATDNDEYNALGELLNKLDIKIQSAGEKIAKVESSIEAIDSNIAFFKQKMTRTQSCDFSYLEESLTIDSGSSHTFYAYQDEQKRMCGVTEVIATCSNGKLSYSRDDFTETCNPVRACDSQECVDEIRYGPIPVGDAAINGLEGWKKIDAPNGLVYFVDPANPSNDPKDHRNGIVVKNGAYSVAVPETALDPGRSIADIVIIYHSGEPQYPTGLTNKLGNEISFQRESENGFGEGWFQVSIEGQNAFRDVVYETFLISEDASNLTLQDLENFEISTVDITTGESDDITGSVILKYEVPAPEAQVAQFSAFNLSAESGPVFGPPTQAAAQRAKRPPPGPGRSIVNEVNRILKEGADEERCGRQTWVCAVFSVTLQKKECGYSWSEDCDVEYKSDGFGGYATHPACKLVNKKPVKIPKSVARAKANIFASKWMAQKQFEVAHLDPRDWKTKIDVEVQCFYRDKDYHYLDGTHSSTTTSTSGDNPPADPYDYSKQRQLDGMMRDFPPVIKNTSGGKSG